MKRVLFTITAIAAFLFAACESDSFDTVITPDGELVNIAIVADTDATRVAVEGKKATWESGDEITVAFIGTKTEYVNFTINSEEDITNEGKSAKFWGTVPAGSYNKITAIYPAVSAGSETITLDRNAEDNVYMSSYSNSPITIDANTTLPMSFKHLMHKVDFNLTLADGYTSTDLEASKLSVEMSIKSGEFAVNFDETKTFTFADNTAYAATQVEKTTVEFAGKSGATSLSASTTIFPLTANNPTITFVVYVGGEKRYEIVKNVESTLSMSAGKLSTINLALSEENAIDKSITLTASKTTIKANGHDYVQFTVKQGNDDVTAKATIYVNDNKIMTKDYATTEAGTYTIYAKLGKEKSNEVTITAEAVADTGTDVVFAKGVTLSSGWYDVNKQLGDHGDTMMCWAASAANILQWWQNQYVAAGNTLPTGCPNGEDSKYGYELQLMDLFRDNWNNLHIGATTEVAIPWYFEGIDVYDQNHLNMNIQYRAYPQPGTGGYFSSAWDSIESKMYTPHTSYAQYGIGYTADINNDNWQGSSISDPLYAFSEYIVTLLERGMIGMAVATAPNFSGGHAVTVWGYEIDNTTGYVTKLYMTDSDDGSGLRTYEVIANEGGSAKIKLSGYATYYPFGLYPVSGPNSAE